VNAATYSSAREAAKVWGAQHGIVGRSGGYLNATSAEAYQALPLALRYRRESDFSLTEASTTRGYSSSRKVQGWDSLLVHLVHLGIVVKAEPQNPRKPGRTRYVLVQS
jgi:hypothetical protein